MGAAEERERSRLLGLLVARAERVSACERPFRKVGWPVIEAALFVRAARSRPVPAWRAPAPRRVAGAVPAFMLDAFCRALDCGVRGARGRFPTLLAVERAFRRLGEGLRLEEFAAATGIGEQRLWSVLQAARRCGALADEGELGWFRPGSAAHREALVRRRTA